MNPFYLDSLNDWNTSLSVQIPVLLSKLAATSNSKKNFVFFLLKLKQKKKAQINNKKKKKKKNQTKKEESKQPLVKTYLKNSATIPSCVPGCLLGTQFLVSHTDNFFLVLLLFLSFFVFKLIVYPAPSSRNPF